MKKIDYNNFIRVYYGLFRDRELIDENVSSFTLCRDMTYDFIELISFCYNDSENVRKEKISRITDNEMICEGDFQDIKRLQTLNKKYWSINDIYESFYKEQEDENAKEKIEENENSNTKTVNIIRENKTNKKNINKKERDNMFNMKNIFGEFGKVNEGELALTYNGQIAVRRNEGEYIRYNKETQELENQMDFVIKDADDFIFILPVNKVMTGDIIKCKNTFYQVLSDDNNGLRVINIKTGTKTKIVKETSIFGFNFYYKVVCLFNMQNNTTANGINPMLLMALQKDDDKDDSMLSTILMMSLMNGGNNQAMGINPMMLMMMDKSGEKGFDMKDIMMMQMMCGGNMNNNVNLFGMNMNNENTNVGTNRNDE